MFIVRNEMDKFMIYKSRHAAMKKEINHDNKITLKQKKEAFFPLQFLFDANSRLVLNSDCSPSSSPRAEIAGMCHQVQLLTKSS